MAQGVAAMIGGRGTRPPTTPNGNSGMRQEGVVLVMVLWLLVLLEVLVGSHAVTARVEGELVQNRLDGFRARMAAEAALYTTIDTLAQQQLGKERLLRTDGDLYQMDYHGVAVAVRVLDEAGKIDLNAARPELLRKLFGNVSNDARVGMQISDAIVDWRDADHVRRETGAEDAEYQEQGRPYGAKDEYLDNLEELLLVLGVDEEIYSKVADILTVNTGSEGVNPMVAPRRVLLAIPGVSAEQVDEYLQARDRHYAQGQPEPPFPIRDNNYISQNRDQLYTIYVEALTSEGSMERLAVLCRVAAQHVARGALPYEILSWNTNLRAMLQEGH